MAAHPADSWPVCCTGISQSHSRLNRSAFLPGVETATKEGNQSHAEEGGSSEHESSALVGVNSTQLNMIHWK